MANPTASQTQTLAHTERTFQFVASAPMERVAPLFGAARERDWEHGWNPVFLWPETTTDREGMVFTVAHGHTESVWVNTQYDVERGRFQYVYVIPDTLATVITLSLQPRGQATAVTVRYDRTALNAEASSRVQAMAEQDKNAAPEWERRINEYLNSKP